MDGHESNLSYSYSYIYNCNAGKKSLGLEGDENDLHLYLAQNWAKIEQDEVLQIMKSSQESMMELIISNGELVVSDVAVPVTPGTPEVISLPITPSTRSTPGIITTCKLLFKSECFSFIK